MANDDDFGSREERTRQERGAQFDLSGPKSPTGTEADPSVAKPAEPEVRKAQPPTLEAEIQTKELLIAEQALKARKEQMAEAQRQKEAQKYMDQKMQELLERQLQQQPRMPTEQEFMGRTQSVGQLQQQLNSQQQSGALRVGAYLATALALAFAFSRRGPAAWGALRGIGEGLQSLQADNQERANQSIRLWKMYNDEAIRQGEKHMEYFHKVMENNKTTLTEKKELLQSYVDYFGHQATSDALLADDWDKTLKLYEGAEKSLKASKNQRATVEGNFFTAMNAKDEWGAYNVDLLKKSKALQEAVATGDKDKIQEAWHKAQHDYPFEKFDQEYRKEHPAKGSASVRNSYLKRVLPDKESQEWFAALIQKTTGDIHEKLISNDPATIEEGLQEAEAQNILPREQFHKEYLKRIKETSQARSAGTQAGKEEEQVDPDNPAGLDLPGFKKVQ